MAIKNIRIAISLVWSVAHLAETVVRLLDEQIARSR
jgi:hypothetical protein